MSLHLTLAAVFSFVAISAFAAVGARDDTQAQQKSMVDNASSNEEACRALMRFRDDLGQWANEMLGPAIAQGANDAAAVERHKSAQVPSYRLVAPNDDCTALVITDWNSEKSRFVKVTHDFGAFQNGMLCVMDAVRQGKIVPEFVKWVEGQEKK